MPTHVLPPDTQAILLLCGSFGQNRQTEPQPLTLSEYNQVAKWLLENQLKPADLLDNAGKNQLEKMPNPGKLTGDRYSLQVTLDNPRRERRNPPLNVHTQL